jgi:spoIIIJ-associated protein
MYEIELRAVSLEEARKTAAFQLGVSPEEIELEVLEEPRGGGELLGGTYRVRARLREDVFSPHPPAASPPQPSATAAAGPEMDLSRFRLTAAEEEAAGPSAAAHTHRGLSLTQPVAGEATEVAAAQEVAARAQQFLQGLLQRLGVAAEVQVREVLPNEVHLEMTGEDLALLIGRYGATLDALQLLTAAAANRSAPQGAHVILDAEDYRARRRASLEKLARATAAKVRRTRREVVLPNLPAHERRIIHLALRDDPDVITYSEGEGNQRRLIIAPKRPERRRPS